MTELLVIVNENNFQIKRWQEVTSTCSIFSQKRISHKPTVKALYIDPACSVFSWDEELITEFWFFWVALRACQNRLRRTLIGKHIWSSRIFWEVENTNPSVTYINFMHEAYFTGKMVWVSETMPIFVVSFQYCPPVVAFL